MPQQPRVIDLRALPPQVRHGLVFQCFDALPTGDSMVIVNDHDPMPLLQQFRFVRPGEAQHEYLEQGPAAWQVRIERKAPGRQAAAPAGGAPDSVTGYLEADHRRLDAILPEVERLAAAGEYRDAARRFAEFTSGLDRHIDAEEQVLFPTFEDATGMASGPTQVMRMEHVQIRERMREAAGSLDREDAGGLAAAVGGLTQVLSVHNMKEEHMLYPMSDRAVQGEAHRQLVQRLRAVTEATP
ncbi:Hemerythrin HHE cation binding domain protein [Anaeromyxobacter dehalogenans 2CP-1]|uniref:Hemerythrin HHE cation binding domain protein n=1 Tax=Anaeromyxobacter dehalogenans (strain ATCC BAA-258 / DSM 21875 / 2CP-1) TaxID=455488 RepID=B8J6M4_ANAD2|nr:DUF2249 domain-containing protein [Anaeromyxobacter dehalogenans]ACL66996.1 Hemerythrin HHE cation binding domain protein [Anaeromyxobacter dehalogenans 2CP-1]